MCHPLYPVARRFVGRPVTVHHITGRTYYGTMQSVVPSGIYLMHGARPVSFDSALGDNLVQQALMDSSRDGTADLVYSPVGYFAFGALTGLTLGALASPYYW